MKKLTKTIASLALGSTILFSSITGASAATYTVKSGDTLSGIAKKYNTSYSAIMKSNSLKSTSLKVGQKLTIGTSASSATKSTTYTVKNGDSLYLIAKKYGTTIAALKKLNGLTSSNLQLGQKLKVSGSSTTATTTTAKKTTSTAATGTKVVNVAKQYNGVKYVFGGTTPSGFDCSGFIYYVFKKSGKSIGRSTAAGYYSKAKKVSSPKVGDLVFFSNTYKKGVSHVGIYLGNGKMISASGKKVNIATIKSGYWKKHLTGYGRI